MSDSLPSQAPVEILREEIPRGGYRAVLFDFDGTLSLIRRSWPQVMIPMMVDVLLEAGSEESREDLERHVEEYVMQLNGKQTIYQMMRLAEEVTQRGGTPRNPIDYKRQYHDLLLQDMGHRVRQLRAGEISPENLTVPDSHALLEELMDKGMQLYLASGTDLVYVRDELAALGLDHFFGKHIYGALDNYQDFSKAQIIRKIVEEYRIPPAQLLGFGDGFVEIEEIRRVGGVAIGVASEEFARTGINDWKRQRLIRAGADIIIGDYRQRDQLFTLLGI